MTGVEARVLVPIDSKSQSVLVFAPDGTGWARLFEPEPLRRIARVRLGCTSEGSPLFVREVFVTSADKDDRGALTVHKLRDLPLAGIEAVINQPGIYDRVRAALSVELGMNVPFPWRTSDPGREGVAWWESQPAVLPARVPLLKLDIPTGYGRPDSFYAEVANRYAYLATVSTRPSNDLAEANGVPATTVHGWVAEARRRGLLPSRRKDAR